jgi:transcriptional regulator GlxA family with amidase domain
MPDSYSMCQLGARPTIVSILSEQAEIANLRSNEGITSWVSSQRRIHMAVKQLARLTTKRNDEGKRVAAPRARRFLIVAVPPVKALDVFGPAEVFGDANRLHGGEPAYEVSIIAAGNDRVISSHIATPVQTDRTYREHSGPIDTLLVAGGVGAREMRYEREFLDWLREYSSKRRRFGSVCTGALVLAEAGILDGRRATTPWNWASDLTRGYPRVTVDPASIYIPDGNCYTSAGVNAGIDLALALVEEDLGRSIAL